MPKWVALGLSWEDSRIPAGTGGEKTFHKRHPALIRTEDGDRGGTFTVGAML